MVYCTPSLSVPPHYAQTIYNLNTSHEMNVFSYNGQWRNKNFESGGGGGSRGTRQSGGRGRRWQAKQKGVRSYLQGWDREKDKSSSLMTFKKKIKITNWWGGGVFAPHAATYNDPFMALFVQMVHQTSSQPKTRRSLWSSDGRKEARRCLWLAASMTGKTRFNSAKCEYTPIRHLNLAILKVYGSHLQSQNVRLDLKK